MKIYPNSEVPISDADCAEIEAIFIELMRDQDAATHSGKENDAGENSGSEKMALPFFDPPGSPEDLRSQWGL
jgi:hypothetical protein